jgi:hypothetical protein
MEPVEYRVAMKYKLLGIRFNLFCSHVHVNSGLAIFISWRSLS